MKYLLLLFFISQTSFANRSNKVLFGNFSYLKDKYIFYVTKISTDNEYELKIQHATSFDTCTFEVRKLTAPIQTVGLSGDLSVYPNDCELSSDKNEFTFRFINITYRFIENGSLTGLITIPKYLNRKKLDFIDYKK